MTDHWTAAGSATVGHSTDRAAHAFTLVADCLFSAPMAQLLAEFGEQLPAPGATTVDSGEDTTG